MRTISTATDTRLPGEAFGESNSELCSRSESGVDVTLLWDRHEDTAIVVVVDHRTGEGFLLDVHESDNALDMFNHPYAYAAHRGVDHWWRAHGQGFRIAA